MENKGIEPQTMQYDAYIQKIRDALEQGQALYAANPLVMQGLLLVYFSILSSAFNYLSDLKQNKEFTLVQNYAFNLLRNDVVTYQALLGPALKNLDTIPCFDPDSGYYMIEHYRYLNKVYVPLLNLFRTYLPKGRYSCSDVERNHISCLTLFSKDGPKGANLSTITQYFLSDPKKLYKNDIARNKQVIMQELGTKLNEFYLVNDNHEHINSLFYNSNYFFYWFGCVINGLWDDFNLLRYGKVTELLMATKKMGDKYFNQKYAELYINMLEHSGLAPNMKMDLPFLRTKAKRYSEIRNTLLGNANPNTHTK